MRQMFLNLSICEEENTFLPSLNKSKCELLCYSQRTVMYKQPDNPCHLTETSETENHITTK